MAMLCLLTLVGVAQTRLSVAQRQVGVAQTLKANETLKRVNASTKVSHKASAASWKESFEDWDEQDMFWLPEGWTAKRTEAYVSNEDPHTWAVQKQLNIYYPAPVDGRYYMTCYYNDDEEQDEWLYSPAVTPLAGEYLTYYVTLRPFMLFDQQYFDRTSESFSQLVPTADLKLYLSVDGGEWEQVQSLFELYREEDISELYELAHNGYMSVRKMFVDMTPYQGRQVRLAFRYHGKGGETMWLDDIELTQLSLTAGYELPQQKMFLGMTPDFRQPASYIYLPDQSPLTWTNTSSMEAETFDWQFVSTSNYAETSHSADADLTTTYTGYVPRSEQVTGMENLLDVPTLNVGGVGGLTAQFTHPVGKMLVGGKAEVVENGSVLKTGASFCQPSKGHDVMISSTGAPYFGVGDGNKELWTRIFQQEAEVTGVGMLVDKPLTAWQLRGLHIQGVGNIIRAYHLSVAVYPFNVYGSVEAEPIATALIDVDAITQQPDPKTGLTMYTLPFTFEDVLTLDQPAIFMLEGLPKAATWFAPLQTAQFEDDVEDSRAIFKYNYVDRGETYEGMNYVSNLGVMGSDGEPTACATNFFFNFDMAYGDCDDWGHVDVTVPGPEMPDITAGDNTIVLVDAESGESLYGNQIPYKPLLCGFYDEKVEDQLTLYVCIGQLYEYEEGPFYGANVNDTYYIKLTMPRSMVDGMEHQVGEEGMKVEYYDLLSHSWWMNATSGTVKVSEPTEHVYEVDVKALDAHSCIALAARYCRPEAWRFHDFNEVRPNPSQFDLSKGGRVMEHHPILSCVVDQSDADLPVFYFADEEGLTSVSTIKALNEKQYVSIQCPTSMMDGLLKGFSGWADDNLTLTYMGLLYNHSNCQHDETCYGGNVAVMLYDTDSNKLNISSTIFTMTQYNMYNMSLHYEGDFVVDNAETGIDNVNENANVNVNENSNVNVNEDLSRGTYNLSGQRVGAAYKGIVIRNGKKVVR